MPQSIVEGVARAAEAASAHAAQPNSWLRDHLPEGFFKQTFLLENWQWAGLAAFIVLGFVLDRAVQFLLVKGVKRTLNKAGATVEVKVLRQVFKPAGLLAMAIFWLVAVPTLQLPGGVFQMLNVAITFLAAAAGVLLAYRLVDIFSDAMSHRASRTQTKLDDLLVPLISKSAKVFVTAFGLVFIAGNLNVNISSLLAGLGLGGLAFALAAKDTVGNLFGTLTVILDRPFQVGDWVLIGDTEGTVERVGFRSSRLRTFYNSVITIPNGQLLTKAVDNMGIRRFRRWKTTVSITYDTPPETIEAFCEGIRELIRIHPYTRKDYYHVYLNAFAGSSLDILLYVFHAAPDWATELRERHRLMLDIIRLADRLGVEFAFPTQTLHVSRGTDEPPAGSLPLDTGAIQASLDEGRREAARIVSGTLGSLEEVPPPVRIRTTRHENVGEAEDGDGGE